MKRTITLENGKEVQISEESYNELAKAVKIEYKVGDTFKHDSSLYMITRGSGFRVSLSCLSTGNIWAECVKLKNYPHVSEEEFSKILGSYSRTPEEFVKVNVSIEED